METVARQSEVFSHLVEWLFACCIYFDDSLAPKVPKFRKKVYFFRYLLILTRIKASKGPDPPHPVRLFRRFRPRRSPFQSSPGPVRRARRHLLAVDSAWQLRTKRCSST